MTGTTTIAEGERLLRLKEVQTKAGISRSSVYKYMDEGRFPRPVQLGPGTVRWKQSEVDGWIAGLAPTAETLSR